MCEGVQSVGQYYSNIINKPTRSAFGPRLWPAMETPGMRHCPFDVGLHNAELNIEICSPQSCK